MENIQSTDLFKVIGKILNIIEVYIILKKVKMTQEKLAELADVSTALIANVESDKINQGISVFTLWKISKALEIPVENLFNGIDKDNHSLRA